MIKVEGLIKELEEVKTKNTTLSTSEVLKLFEIQALKELVNQIRRDRR